MSDEKIQALNQITAIIDEKAALFKEERFSMPAARKSAEQTLLLKLISDALALAEEIEPKPFSLIQDFKRLEKDIRAF